MKTLIFLLISVLTGWSAEVNMTNITRATVVTTNDLVLGMTNAAPNIVAGKTRLLNLGDIMGLVPTNYIEIDVGDLVVSNTITAMGERITCSVSNVWYDTGPTNLVLNFGIGRLWIFATNEFALTNFSGLEAGYGTATRYLHVTIVGCSNTACTITYPTFGAAAPQYSVCIRTNSFKPIITSLTNGVWIEQWWTANGTNLSVTSQATF